MKRKDFQNIFLRLDKQELATVATLRNIDLIDS